MVMVNKNILIILYMKVILFMELNKDMENIIHKINKLFIKDSFNLINLQEKGCLFIQMEKNIKAILLRDSYKGRGNQNI